LCLRSLAGFRLNFLGSFFFSWLVGVNFTRAILSSLCSTLAVVPELLPSSGPSGGCFGDLLLCSSFLSPLCQTVVVPEWEPVGTAVFCSASSF
jgi:hypothetical protein